MAKMLGVRGQALEIAPDGVRPAVSADGIQVLSMDLLLAGDDTPVVWEAPTQAEAHTWRGTMEGTALREFLTDTAWGALDVLLIDLPPGSDRLPTLLDLLPGLTGAVVVTIPSEVSHLVVRRAMTLARERGARLLGLIENMAGYVCPTCGTVGPLFDGPGGDATAAKHGVPFLGRVAFDPRLAAAGDRGRPFVLEHGETPAGRALTAIAGTLAERLLAEAGAHSAPAGESS
jgi:ATP-binding protein involved in chromosome partitioning